MIKAWLRKRAEAKALKEKIANDEYLTRLSNSAQGFCGTRHEGAGPFLSISEIHKLIHQELDSQRKNIDIGRGRY